MTVNPSAFRDHSSCLVLRLGDPQSRHCPEGLCDLTFPAPGVSSPCPTREGVRVLGGTSGDGPFIPPKAHAFHGWPVVILKDDPGYGTPSTSLASSYAAGMCPCSHQKPSSCLYRRLTPLPGFRGEGRVTPTREGLASLPGEVDESTRSSCVSRKRGTGVLGELQGKKWGHCGWPHGHSVNLRSRGDGGMVCG